MTGPACIGKPMDLWFQRPRETQHRWQLRQQEALAVCTTCPAITRAACLEQALRFPISQQKGVVGGTTAHQRRELLAALNRTERAA